MAEVRTMAWSNRKSIVMGAIAVLLLLVGSFIYMRFAQPCDALNVIDASIRVRIIPNRNYLGFTADADSLKFGGVSPGVTSQRKVTVQYPRDTVVNVTMLGPLQSWTGITPHGFILPSGQSQEVIFEVSVPPWAQPGNYTGKAVFCFKEIK